MKRVLLVFVAACGGHAHAVAPSEPRCEGSFTITSQEELAELGRCETVQGDVTIRGGGSLDLRAIGEVENITGALTIGPTFALDSIGIERLHEVGALHIVSNGLVGAVYLPRLEDVLGTVEIAANVSIATVALSNLETVKGDLIIEQNPSLEILDLGMLEQVDGVLQLRNDPILLTVDIETLEHVGAVDLTGSGIPEDHPLRKHTGH